MDFLVFQVVAGLQPPLDECRIFTFFHGISPPKPPHIANYMAALRAFHIVHGLETQAFRDEQIPLFLKSVKIEAPLRPTVRSYIDVTILKSIIHQCLTLPHRNLTTIILVMLLVFPSIVKFSATYH